MHRATTRTCHSKRTWSMESKRYTTGAPLPMGEAMRRLADADAVDRHSGEANIMALWKVWKEAAP